MPAETSAKTTPVIDLRNPVDRKPSEAQLASLAEYIASETHYQPVSDREMRIVLARAVATAPSAENFALLKQFVALEIEAHKYGCACTTETGCVCPGPRMVGGLAPLTQEQVEERGFALANRFGRDVLAISALTLSQVGRDLTAFDQQLVRLEAIKACEQPRLVKAPVRDQSPNGVALNTLMSGLPSVVPTRKPTLLGKIGAALLDWFIPLPGVRVEKTTAGEWAAKRSN